jgi:hypothetical protein
MDETVDKISEKLAENMRNYPDSRFVSDDDVAMAYLLYKLEDSEKRYSILIERLQKELDYYQKLIVKCREMNLNAGEYVGIGNRIQQILKETSVK